ncbi:15653_t:CDS:1, partial [Funneliformis caledonium]
LDVNHLSDISKIHSYYITNAATELNYVNQDITDKEIEDIISRATYCMFTETDMFDDEYFQDESDFTQSYTEPILDSSFSEINLRLEEYFDFNEDFNQEEFLKNTEEIEQIEHGNKNFDIESLLQDIE